MDKQTDRRDWTPYPSPAAVQPAWVITLHKQQSFVLTWKQCQASASFINCAYITHVLFCTVLFFSVFNHPRSEGWPHHRHTFSIYLCPLSFWLTLPRIVLSTYWRCPSRPCMVFIACVHLALFLALSLSPGNSLVSSWCNHSMLASLLWQWQTVPSLLQLC